MIATLDVLKRVGHELHCVVDYQIRDLLTDSPKLNLMPMLQIYLNLFLPLVNGDSVASLATPMSFRSIPGRGCQCRSQSKRRAVFGAPDFFLYLISE